MNIAIFGGSFDPPHEGHIEVIKEALDELDIDTLYIVPAFLNPFKESSFAPPNKRLEWIRATICDFTNVEICEYEIECGRATPSINTVRFLKKKVNPTKIYLIIGADNLANLHKWHEYEQLMELVELVVAKRDGIAIPEGYKTLKTDVPTSSSSFKERLEIELIPQSIRDDVIKFFKEINEQKG